jgi:hypothetical protein
MEHKTGNGTAVVISFMLLTGLFVELQCTAKLCGESEGAHWRNLLIRNFLSDRKV